MKFNRRELLKNAALVSGATLAAAPFYSEKNLFGQLTLPTLPNPENSGIEHIVVVTMENRSFRPFSRLVAECRRSTSWLDLSRHRRRGPLDAFAFRRLHRMPASG